MKKLKITMLYPREMNIYGDFGNLESLAFRAEQYGYQIEKVMYEPGDIFPLDSDIVLGGGGQDSGQGEIMADLLAIGPQLRKMSQSGVPMLMICGLYQMFGHYFLTSTDEKIEGIGLFDAYTKAGPRRMIGNIITDWEGYKLIGYENHSGLTFLSPGQRPMAKMVNGMGNNGDDGTEGAMVNNVFGSYLHGPILPKNPKFADYLLSAAVENKFGDKVLKPRNQEAAKMLISIDKLAESARRIAITRPR